MMHDNWGDKFSPDGSALVPAVDYESTHKAMVEGRDPTPEQSRAILDGPPPSAVPAKADGTVTRPDWNVPARNESGQFISTSQAGLREQFEREGGFELNRDRVLAAESAILSLSENPAALQARIATLPESIQLKAANIMRLSAGYRDGGAMKWLQLEDSLTPSELNTFLEFWRKLPQGDRDAIELAMSK